ncbi:MAG TPA: murein transglycosylase A [Rhizomicrobium sp.]|jgi:membrane-bound lytic murein transglycosylase A|nr:murein transglycosylase A [Rhizomicrobium sp.]
MRRAGSLLVCLWLAGCATPPTPSVPSGPDTVQLTRVTFADLPGWQESSAALDAFRKSCAVLKTKPDSASMAYAGTLADWRGVCADPQGADFFEKHFTPYRIAGEGLFTGYYEPQIAASRSRHDQYQTPIYGPPPDLVRADLGQFIPKLKGEHISGRVQGAALVPYPDRAAIDAGGVAAPLLFWAADPIAFFFLQIQGSGRLVLDDGSRARIAYAGENGRPYTAIGRTLIAQGELSRENVSLQSIRAWLLAHPDKARTVMQTNPSYVFFREAEGAGAGGTSLTPLGSMAVDLRLHPLGAPFFVAADGPDPVHALLVAQDTGGAIRGPARADIFFGAGDEAERRAGALKAPGALYVLLPNTLAVP